MLLRPICEICLNTRHPNGEEYEPRGLANRAPNACRLVAQTRGPGNMGLGPKGKNGAPKEASRMLIYRIAKLSWVASRLCLRKHL